MASGMVRLDGRTGEGGGQLVRVAVALAALTGAPLRIDNVRGNREGKRGGGELNTSGLHFCANFHQA
jgi:RNA 3'-terminal phosphate cyclase (ATP)